MRAAGSSEAFGPTGSVGLDPERVAAFGARQLGAEVDQLRVHTQPLRGGLESAAVARWVIQRQDGTGPRSLTFVVKRLDGLQQREGAIYTGVLAEIGDSAPALLGLDQVGADMTYLYLEYVRRAAPGRGQKRPRRGGSWTPSPRCTRAFRRNA